MRAIVVACMLAVAFTSCPDVGAQYPDRPIRIIMPFPAGATADSVARVVAAPLSQALGQTVLVDNRPGADGAMAAELAARSPADGYTLFSGGNTQILGVPTLRKNPPYDPLRDFTPITQLVRFAFFLVVHPGTPVNTVSDLVDYARAHPGRLNYASGNVNGILAAAQLMSLTGVNIVHVPYKGEPLAIPDLLDARVHLMFGTGGVVAPLVKEGKLRALATLAPARTALLPDVPTVSEIGMPRLSIVIWNGLFAPAKTPKEIVERLSREVNAILKRDEVREQFARQGVEPSSSTPEEFAAFVKQQLVDWGKAAREAGMRPE